MDKNWSCASSMEEWDRQYLPKKVKKFLSDFRYPQNSTPLWEITKSRKDMILKIRWDNTKPQMCLSKQDTCTVTESFFPAELRAVLSHFNLDMGKKSSGVYYTNEKGTFVVVEFAWPLLQSAGNLSKRAGNLTSNTNSKTMSTLPNQYVGDNMKVTPENDDIICDAKTDTKRMKQITIPSIVDNRHQVESLIKEEIDEEFVLDEPVKINSNENIPAGNSKDWSRYMQEKDDDVGLDKTSKINSDENIPTSNGGDRIRYMQNTTNSQVMEKQQSELNTAVDSDSSRTIQRHIVEEAIDTSESQTEMEVVKLEIENPVDDYESGAAGNSEQYENMTTDEENLMNINSYFDVPRRGKIPEGPCLKDWKTYYKFSGKKVMCHNGEMIFQMCRKDQVAPLSIAYIVSEYPSTNGLGCPLLIPEPSHSLHDGNLWKYYQTVYCNCSVKVAKLLTPEGKSFGALKQFLENQGKSVAVALPLFPKCYRK